MRTDNIEFGFEVEAKNFTKPLIHQVHGNKVFVTNTLEIPKPHPADAIVTSVRGEDIYVFTADCLSVLLFSNDKIAAVHAGWRGARLGVVREALRKFEGKKVRAIFGPCLRPCCFEVKEDFVSQFRKSHPDFSKFLLKRNDKMFFDLPAFVRHRDLSELSDEDIDPTSNYCTYCHKPELPSFRRNGGTDPRIRAWVRMK